MPICKTLNTDKALSLIELNQLLIKNRVCAGASAAPWETPVSGFRRLLHPTRSSANQSLSNAWVVSLSAMPSESVHQIWSEASLKVHLYLSCAPPGSYQSCLR